MKRIKGHSPHSTSTSQQAVLASAEEAGVPACAVKTSFLILFEKQKKKDEMKTTASPNNFPHVKL